MASQTLPKTMKGISMSKTGGTEVLELKADLPVPTAKAGQVLIKNAYTGVNYIDTYFRTGLYPPPNLPYILGRETEGTIVSAPSGTAHGLQQGDRVVALAEATYAEYTAAAADKTIKIPDAMEPKVACAALLQGLTALTLIREAHRVQKGDWVLVHAAAGGVGLWLCQLLRAVGAKVVATASTAGKRELAKANGAQVVVGYEVEEVKRVVMNKTGGDGVVVVFDSVGQATFDLSLEVLARKGTMVSFGNASGAVEPFKITRLSAKNLKLVRPALFNYVATREEFETYSNELFDLILKDKMDVRIHEVYPLEDVARAQMDLEGRKTTGKLLLQV